MDIRTSYFWLLLGVLWGLISACEPVLQGQVPARTPDFEKALQLLLKDSILQENFTINEQGIRIHALLEEQTTWHIYPREYATAKFILRNKPAEEVITLLNEKGTSTWKDQAFSIDSLSLEQESFHPDSTQILRGLKVALDPGHMAGNMSIAELEGKYVKIPPSRHNQYERIEFFEAQLNLATAHLIRKELEAKGAEVFMTRTEAGVSSMDIDYWTWKEEKWDSTLQASLLDGDITEDQASYYKNKAPEDKIFNHFFVRKDLQNRAKSINAFGPDLTLIIHYNVDAPNWLNRNKLGEFTPTEENYAMAFVPGAFMEGELIKAEDRVDFLRLLLNAQDLEASVRLSELFLKHSLALTQVPLVNESQGLSYLSKASILTASPGVYARNLSLSRMIKGPLVYGESLCQDNAEESIRLNKKNLQVEGIWVSDRVQAIAQAYINAVIDFAEEY